MAYLLCFTKVPINRVAKYQFCVMTLLVLLPVTIINTIRVEIRSNRDTKSRRQSRRKKRNGANL